MQRAGGRGGRGVHAERRNADEVRDSRVRREVEHEDHHLVHRASCIVHLASCISPVLRALCAEGRAGAMRLRSAHEGRAVGHRQQRQQHGLLVHVVPTSGATPPYVGALRSSQVRRLLATPHALAFWRMLRRVLVHTVSAAGQVVWCLPRAVHGDTRRLS